MDKFEFSAPTTINEAVAAQNGTAHTQFIAGGTDLIPRMRAGVLRPQSVIDLGQLGWDKITIQAEELMLGSMVTFSQVIASEILQEKAPVLIQACKDIAGPPIRNRGTLGGNLANASPAADTAPPLLVLDTRLKLVSNGETRELYLCEFFQGPGKTVLQPGELIQEIVIPLRKNKSAATFIKLGQRKAMAIAIASASTALTINKQGEIEKARIALGSVAPTPIRVLKAESALLGKSGSEELFSQVGEMASLGCHPISDLRASGSYRRKMVAVLVRRALEQCWTDLTE